MGADYRKKISVFFKKLCYNFSMAKLAIQIKDKNDEILAEKAFCEKNFLVYQSEYEEGDKIEVLASEYPCYAVISLDDTMAESLIYLTSTFVFTIPFAETKKSYNPKSFSSNRHYITARLATEKEISSYRDLAFNPYDNHDNSSAFPHAFANVETRGEAVFAARNAIDGLFANDMHGEWPWTSWGINRNPEAEFHLDFGRKVKINRLVITLRADFPHDACWKSGRVTFSDGSIIDLNFKESGEAQVFDFVEKEINSLKFDKLIRYDEHSPFPALTQFQVFGWEVL